MQGLGYKEILAYLDGECTLEEAKEIIKTRYQTFCETPAYLVQAGTGHVIWLSSWIMDKQTREALADLTEILKRRESSVS